MRIQCHNRVAIFTALAVSLLLVSNLAMQQAPPASTSAAEAPSPVCDTLFRVYACGGKVNTGDREAAVVLVASRGRGTGFGRVVLQTLRETDEQQTETKCARILGRMLAVDGCGRAILEAEQRSGKPYGGQWRGPYVVLDESVVEELLKRAGSFKDRRDYRIGHCVEVLAAAHDPRTREYLLNVMRNGPPAHPGDTDCFRTECCLTAAIGLARLREPAGIEWLVENCESTAELMWRYPPPPSGYEQLGMACRRALDGLRDDGTHELTTRARGQAWWDRAKTDFKPSDPEPAEHKEDR